MNFLIGFFAESSNQSMMRLMQFLLIVSVLTVFLAGNTANFITSIRVKTSFTICGFTDDMLWAIGLAMAGKAVQKLAELKGKNSQSQPEQPKQ